MELSPFQRLAAFAVVVLVLAGLGAYLFLPQSPATGSGRSPSHPGSSSPAPAPSPGGPAPSGQATPSGQAAPDIYQWLPFTQAGLAPMRPLITSQLAVALGRAFAAPGVAGTRVSSRQVATATAAIVALRAFGPSSLTFVVAITQRIASSKGTSKRTTYYAVTLTGTGSSWQVNDIELASAGNQ